MQYFHGNAASGDTENGLVINRNGIYKTFSITQAEFRPIDNRPNETYSAAIDFIHQDLLADEIYYNSLKIKELAKV